MPLHRFIQLDVFSDRLLRGNALAVVFDAGGLDPETMQRIAAWTNLAETVFLLPPSREGADYRVRIFTSRHELPFAGHPSVGAAYAALHAGLLPAGRHAFVQECAAGLLPVRVEGEGETRVIHVQAPPARLEDGGEALTAALEAALGLALPQPPRPVTNGPRWIVCDLGEGAAVRARAPDMAALARIAADWNAAGACLFGRERDGSADMAVRAFCPLDSLPEDPVTGSANAAIAAYLRGTGGLARYGRAWRASQGREVDRDGYVEVRVDGRGEISVGGACALGVVGELRL